ncbi:NAD/NADP octopine/nopaline dehydrogenase family protein [Hathewaya massiliensis]|uniref:NAD/NADP octopine/nopaline dehydrogenase family protein n=1 Tax=Hathewaya massiliensis TaxID=1964382 RepID=UPI00163C79D5|nr:NAD/NADP-dependent octopine/nopaline dehydrogenase family protein [Hathewaya massiliensis]
MIAVLGAGNGGIAISTYLEEKGIKTTVWNRTEDRIKNIEDNNNIVEVTKVEENSVNNIRITKLTNDIESAICNAKYIFVVTPGNAHIDIAKIVAPFIREDQVFILMPGRTYGSLVFSEKIKELRGFCPTCIETQTILHACRINKNKLYIHGLKAKVLYSHFDKLEKEHIDYIQSIIPEFVYEEDYFKVTLNNIGALLHPIPTILNLARIESGSKFKYYTEGFSPTVVKYIENVDAERKIVCEKIGCQYISLLTWLNREYGSSGASVYESINEIEAYKNIASPDTIEHRYIYDDISTGLVPIYYTGKEFGIELKYIKAVIDFASLLMDYDFINLGRRFNKEMLCK